MLLALLLASAEAFAPVSFTRPAGSTMISCEGQSKKRIRKDRSNVVPPRPSSPPAKPIVSSPPPSSFTPDSAPSTNLQPSTPTTPTANNDFSSLLADSEKFRSNSKDLTADEKIGDELMQKVKGAISTLITVDFFLILGFLAWFIVGVISSTMFKNDTIQIAFNGIFQPLVQPALGILMIGSVAGGAFGKDEDKPNP
ncbi:hypothetical protein TrLO_g15938 [Triparma laevis f. longispina]|uniref:Uncharacterized protein n=1 Tax=Triparma laevis f. longispina TaxID=1714387 RepID=A0A9W7DVP8_9STRA|nr:hypothetical protein TrLO_g15938 [Triparma laevis f. longispina]